VRAALRQLLEAGGQHGQDVPTRPSAQGAKYGSYPDAPQAGRFLESSQVWEAHFAKKRR
jgi:hypothetical protein